MADQAWAQARSGLLQKQIFQPWAFAPVLFLELFGASGVNRFSFHLLE